MAEAAKRALEVDSFQIVADAGCSNGEQVAHCEEAGMIPHIPVIRTVNNQGGGRLFGREHFHYEPDSDTYVCPGNKRLLRKSTNHKDRYTMYKASTGDCGACSLSHAARRLRDVAWLTDGTEVLTTLSYPRSSRASSADTAVKLGTRFPCNNPRWSRSHDHHATPLFGAPR